MKPGANYVISILGTGSKLSLSSVPEATGSHVHDIKNMHMFTPNILSFGRILFIKVRLRYINVHMDGHGQNLLCQL